RPARFRSRALAVNRLDVAPDHPGHVGGATRPAFHAGLRRGLQGVRDVSWQPDLFSSRGGEVTVDAAAFRSGRRTALDARSWVEVFPAWLAGADELFQRLAEAVPWQAHYRWLFRQRFLEPRLTAEYRRLADAPHPALVLACDALSEHYGVRYDNLWLNLYRGGEDSTGWHRARFSCRRPECIVPVLTLGATRRFLLKPRVGGPSLAFHPSAGD